MAWIKIQNEKLSNKNTKYKMIWSVAKNNLAHWIKIFISLQILYFQLREKQKK